VISGYLISGIILGATSAGRFSYAHFYARRIRRIFPARAVVLAGVLVAGWFRITWRITPSTSAPVSK
jgi:peptidoglycan/LPS O-acetylase OafA/YrhL